MGITRNGGPSLAYGVSREAPSSGRADAQTQNDIQRTDSGLAVLPVHRDESLASAIPAPDVTKLALRLHYLIEEVVPYEMEEDQITKPHSRIITNEVIQAAREAGGREYRACVVYCLLVNKRWFKHQALGELWDANLHTVRAVACEVIAKAM